MENEKCIYCKKEITPKEKAYIKRKTNDIYCHSCRRTIISTLTLVLLLSIMSLAFVAYRAFILFNNKKPVIKNDSNISVWHNNNFYLYKNNKSKGFISSKNLKNIYNNEISVINNDVPFNSTDIMINSFLNNQHNAIAEISNSFINKNVKLKTTIMNIYSSNHVNIDNNIVNFNKIIKNYKFFMLNSLSSNKESLLSKNKLKILLNEYSAKITTLNKNIESYNNFYLTYKTKAQNDLSNYNLLFKKSKTQEIICLNDIKMIDLYKSKINHKPIVINVPHLLNHKELEDKYLTKGEKCFVMSQEENLRYARLIKRANTYKKISTLFETYGEEWGNLSSHWRSLSEEFKEWGGNYMAQGISYDKLSVKYDKISRSFNHKSVSFLIEYKKELSIAQLEKEKSLNNKKLFKKYLMLSNYNKNLSKLNTHKNVVKKITNNENYNNYQFYKYKENYITDYNLFEKYERNYTKFKNNEENNKKLALKYINRKFIYYKKIESYNKKIQWLNNEIKEFGNNNYLLTKSYFPGFINSYVITTRIKIILLTNNNVFNFRIGDKYDVNGKIIGIVSKLKNINSKYYINLTILIVN